MEEAFQCLNLIIVGKVEKGFEFSFESFEIS